MTLGYVHVGVEEILFQDSGLPDVVFKQGEAAESDRRVLETSD